jgi:hypothetical protein
MHRDDIQAAIDKWEAEADIAEGEGTAIARGYAAALRACAGEMREGIGQSPPTGKDSDR